MVEREKEREKKIDHNNVPTQSGFQDMRPLKTLRSLHLYGRRGGHLSGQTEIISLHYF